MASPFNRGAVREEERRVALVFGLGARAGRRDRGRLALGLVEIGDSTCSPRSNGCCTLRKGS